jgi:hypothetical protein
MPSSSDLRLILAAGATIALAAFFVSASEARGLRADLTLERAKADSLFRAYRDARAQVDGTTTMAQQRERELQRLLKTARLRRVRSTVPPSAPPETVRVIATEALAELDTLYDMVDSVTQVTQRLAEDLAVERKAARIALATADSTIAFQRTVIRALEAPPTPCRVLGVPCPTRTQSAAVAAILTLLAVTAR